MHKVYDKDFHYLAKIILDILGTKLFSCVFAM